MSQSRASGRRLRRRSQLAGCSGAGRERTRRVRGGLWGIAGNTDQPSAARTQRNAGEKLATMQVANPFFRPTCALIRLLIVEESRTPLGDGPSERSELFSLSLPLNSWLIELCVAALEI